METVIFPKTTYKKDVWLRGTKKEKAEARKQRYQQSCIWENIISNKDFVACEFEFQKQKYVVTRYSARWPGQMEIAAFDDKGVICNCPYGRLNELISELLPISSGIMVTITTLTEQKKKKGQKMKKVEITKAADNGKYILLKTSAEQCFAYEKKTGKFYGVYDVAYNDSDMNGYFDKANRADFRIHKNGRNHYLTVAGNPYCSDLMKNILTEYAENHLQ